VEFICMCRLASPPTAGAEAGSGPALAIVQELLDGGSLLDKVAKAITGDRYADLQAIQWCKDVAEAVKHLHLQDPPLVHRDVKPANSLLTRPHDGGRPVAKLADFGLCKSLPTAPLLAQAKALAEQQRRATAQGAAAETAAAAGAAEAAEAAGAAAAAAAEPAEGAGPEGGTAAAAAAAEGGGGAGGEPASPALPVSVLAPEPPPCCQPLLPSWQLQCGMTGSTGSPLQMAPEVRGQWAAAAALCTGPALCAARPCARQAPCAWLRMGGPVCRVARGRRWPAPVLPPPLRALVCQPAPRPAPTPAAHAQVFLNQAYGCPADVFSFGLLLYEVCGRAMLLLQEFPGGVSAPRSTCPPSCLPGH
jgi:serine/threonine protein kinase